MRKGQGSLEYLLILAAILAIAVVVVVVANSMLAPGQEAGEVAQDKYNCGVVGIEVDGYTKQPASKTDTATMSTWNIVYQGIGPCSPDDTALTSPDATCRVGREDDIIIEVKKFSSYDINCSIRPAP